MSRRYGSVAHLALQHKLLSSFDAQQDALLVFDLGLLHRQDLLHRQQVLLHNTREPIRGEHADGGRHRPQHTSGVVRPFFEETKKCCNRGFICDLGKGVFCSTE